MGFVLVLVALTVLAVLALRAMPRPPQPSDPSSGPSDGGATVGAGDLEVGHAPLTEDVLTIDERVEIGSIIDDWVDLPGDTLPEQALVDRCEVMLTALAEREGNADVDTACAALRSILAMALFRHERYRECVTILREQPIPESLLEARQRSVHPLPLLARALAKLGEDDEARAALDQDEALDDRRDPDAAVLAAAERDRVRATLDAR